ncbi:MAG: hypothetical protein BWY70_01932 [Bacteroidetes bacterium ADurb.Bin408]|nr:MAG: hypothetical protein BWY70_01932 [Bacteroidetes bacterium ADurb.Bin408]
MQPVAIGRFGNQDIGLWKGLGRFDDAVELPANIARETKIYYTAVFFYLQIYGGTAQDVTGISKSKGNIIGYSEFLPV